MSLQLSRSWTNSPRPRAAIPSNSGFAHLSDLRAPAVLHTAASGAAWAEWTSREAVGHGIGYARYKNSSAYCAVVAEVEAIDGGQVRRLFIAVDAGLVINPNGAVNQIEGGAIQATSWALKERVRFDRLNVTSDTWETYPDPAVLRRLPMEVIESPDKAIHRWESASAHKARRPLRSPTRFQRARHPGALDPHRRAAHRRDARLARATNSWRRPVSECASRTAQ